MGGHYWALMRSFESNKWFEFNDICVSDLRKLIPPSVTNSGSAVSNPADAAAPSCVSSLIVPVGERPLPSALTQAATLQQAGPDSIPVFVKSAGSSVASASLSSPTPCPPIPPGMDGLEFVFGGHGTKGSAYMLMYRLKAAQPNKPPAPPPTDSVSLSASFACAPVSVFVTPPSDLEAAVRAEDQKFQAEQVCLLSLVFISCLFSFGIACLGCLRARTSSSGVHGCLCTTRTQVQDGSR